MSQDNVFLFLSCGHSIPGTPTVSGSLQAVGPPLSTAAWQVDVDCRLGLFAGGTLHLTFPLCHPCDVCLFLGLFRTSLNSVLVFLREAVWRTHGEGGHLS